MNGLPVYRDNSLVAAVRGGLLGRGHTGHRRHELYDCERDRKPIQRDNQWPYLIQVRHIDAVNPCPITAGRLPFKMPLRLRDIQELHAYQTAGLRSNDSNSFAVVTVCIDLNI